MSEKNIIYELGDGLLTGVVRFANICWMGINGILFPTKVIYLSDQARATVKKNPCIFIANHTSHKDGFVIPHKFYSKKMYTLVTNKWYSKKGLRVFFSHLRYIPIQLDEMDNSWLDKAKLAIEKGASVLIFPEGRLERGDGLVEFQPGFLMLARHTEAPIVPIAVTREYEMFHRQYMYVGEQIECDVHRKGRPSQIFREGANICHAQIENMLKNAQK